jgi:hypothetical protein
VRVEHGSANLASSQVVAMELSPCAEGVGCRMGMP